MREKTLSKQLYRLIPLLGEADGVDNAVIVHHFTPPGHVPGVYYPGPD